MEGGTTGQQKANGTTATPSARTEPRATTAELHKVFCGHHGPVLNWRTRACASQNIALGEAERLHPVAVIADCKGNLAYFSVPIVLPPIMTRHCTHKQAHIASVDD